VPRVVAVALSFGLLCLGGHASATPAATSPPQAHFRLANGLDVLIEEDHREPHVAVLVSYDVGTRDEPKGYASLAHLVEHLTFRRSRHLHDYAGIELLERAGAENMNGETHADRTLYYAVVPSKALPLALWIESERMGFTLEAFDQSTFDHERSVIRAEVDSKQNEYTRFGSHFLNALYGERHPYAEPLYPAQDLDDLTLKNAEWFFQHGYRPDNAHLVIVGDVGIADARTLAERYFGGLVNPAAPRGPRPPLAPARTTGAHLTYLTPARVSFFFVAYPAPRYGSQAHVAARLLVQALNALLAPVLVDQRRLALFLNIELNDDALDSQFLLRAAPREGVTLAELDAAVRSALAQVTREQIAGVFHEVRAQLLEHEWMMLENPLERARAHVESLAFDGRPYDSAAEIRALLALTDADLVPVLHHFAKPLLVAEMQHDPGVGSIGGAHLSQP